MTVQALPQTRVHRPAMSPFSLLIPLAALLPFCGGDPIWLHPGAIAAVGIPLVALVAARLRPLSATAEAGIMLVGLIASLALVLTLIGQTPAASGSDAPGLWLLVVGDIALLWHALGRLATTRNTFGRLVVAGLFGLALVVLWEAVVRGFQVPSVLLPPPSMIIAAIPAHGADLWDDFRQTVLKAVIFGFVAGSGAGFIVAVIADRVPFLARGLLPFGNLVSAMPIVGIAPIMVMWFGFDWQSKAAVVIVTTFFPMLVNTLAGLQASEAIELDLMRSYGAGYFRTLTSLRLPNALPFMFNGLKINATLSLISAVVAEFFGTPIVGMGFRISTEVARMNLDVVWATIVVAAVVGSAMYGGLTLIERAVTAWHPSIRGH